ncbi:hypothetical protein Tco_0340730 [Tanacetum coccineum]
MSCRQIESLPEHTDVVPFTYHLNGHYIEFGREEFCLITGLRFGPENSDHYVEGINPFKRLLFGSDIDGGHITGQMLLDKINGEEFSKLQDEDVVAVCQLAILHLILLGRRLRNIIQNGLGLGLRVDNHKFYACQALPNRPLAKYTLSGFTWVFKGQSKTVEVSEHYRFNHFSGFKNSRGSNKMVPKLITAQDSDSLFMMWCQQPKFIPTTFEQPMPSRYPTSYPSTPYITTPMAQQGFASWSSTSYEAGP